MVGGGSNKRDDGLPAISSTNIFSALESRRKKKTRSDKDKNEGLKTASEGEKSASTQVWTAAPVSVSSWADCEEDDDEYFALPALPPILDVSSSVHDAPSYSHEDASQDESEGDDEEDLEEENEEQETETTEPEVDAKVATPPVVTPTAREPDRQLSKKELKKKELAELDAVLAELGLNPKEEKDAIEEEHENGVTDEPTEAAVTRGPALTESKSSKRRKAKKDKPLQKDEKEDETTCDQLEPKDDTSVENTEKEPDSVTSDPKEILKKLALVKKKKSFKESDSAAKAAAAEAAARAARLAALKKKEKNHYNQQPVR